MSTIVTRAGKGSPLTYNEVDSNFTNLNTDKIQSGDTVGSLTITSATINGGTITGITDIAVADGGTGASTASGARTNLGLVIGTDVQAYDADLTTWAGKTAPTGDVVGTTDSQTLTNKTLTDPAIIGTAKEDVFDLTDGATVDIDPSNGSIQTLTLTSTGRTLTFTNMLAGEAITLMVNDGTAGTITTWNATFVNNSGSAPTLSTTGYTVVSIWKVSTTVYAAVVGNA